MVYKLSTELIGHLSDVKCVNWINENVLVSGSRDLTGRIWSNVNSEWINNYIIKTHDNYVNSVNYLKPNDEHPNGTGFLFIRLYFYLILLLGLIATGSQDKIVNLHEILLSEFNAESVVDAPIYTLLGHNGNVCSIDVLEDLIVTGSWDSYVLNCLNLSNCY